MENYKLYNGDCLRVMKDLPDKSVNLVLIDPPYNISKDKWDKWKTVDDYVEFMGKVFLEVQRVLKENGNFYFFHNDFLQMAELQHWIKGNTNFKFKSLITWNKTNFKKFAWTNRNPEKCMDRNWFPNVEYCLYYTFKTNSFDTGWEKVKNQNNFKIITDKIKNDINISGVGLNDIYAHAYKEGRYKTLESAKVNIRYKLGLSNGHRFDLIDEKMYNHMKSIIKFSFTYGELHNKYYKIKHILNEEKTKYEQDRYVFNLNEVQDNISCVWEFDNIANKGDLHPTQKPLNILEKIIKTSSNERDIVLDCFMGSGSTGVACINTNRKFIGIELDENYFNIAKERIENCNN